MCTDSAIWTVGRGDRFHAPMNAIIAIRILLPAAESGKVRLLLSGF